MPAGWLAPVVPAVIGGAIATASVTTYSRAADGPYPQFVTAHLLGLGALVLVAVWLAVRGARLWQVVTASLLVALPAPALHAARHGGEASIVETRLREPAAVQAAFDVTTTGEARLRWDGREVRLRVPSGSTGYLAARRPAAPWYRVDLPRALAAGGTVPAREEVAFEGAISLDNLYFVLLQTDGLLAQLTSWGLMLTVPGPNGQPTGIGVSVPTESGSFHSWRLKRGSGRTSLERDGVEVWSSGDASPFGAVRIGETKTDREHGGELRLRAFSYRMAQA